MLGGFAIALVIHSLDRLTRRLLRRVGIHIDEPTTIDLMRRQYASLDTPSNRGIRQAGMCGVLGDGHSLGRLLGHA